MGGIKHYSNIFMFAIAGYMLSMFLFPEQIKIESLAFVAITFFYILMKQKKLYLNYCSFSWILYIVTALLSTLFSKANTADVVEFCVSLLIGVLVYSYDYNDYNTKYTSTNTYNGYLKAIALVPVVAMIGCLFQVFFPSFLINFNRWHLGESKYNIFYEYFRGDNMLGFSFQTGVNGFYIAVLIAFLFCTLLFKKNISIKHKILISVLCLINFVFLFFTGKRVFIILTILIGILLLCICYQKHFIKIIFVSLVLIVGVIILFTNTEYGINLLERSQGENWSTGRMQIYKTMFSLFTENPIFGKGACSTLHFINNYQNGHNIYLQILCESGIFGFLILIPTFIIDITRSIKILKRQIKLKVNYSQIAICLFIQLIFIGWGMSGNPLYDVYPLFLYMVVSGITRSMKSKLEKGDYLV